jgi:hypothetical protein
MSTLAEKQAYLRQAILEKGYNTEAFIEFLTSRKEQGDDLNLWTQAELVQVAQEFITMSDYAKQHEQLLKGKALPPAPAPATKKSITCRKLKRPAKIL